MTDPPANPPALTVVADAIARRSQEWRAEAQAAVAAALTERGRDPALARLIASPTAPPDPPAPPVN